MKHTTVLAALFAAAALAAPVFAEATLEGGMMVDEKGMTLYTFDKDTAGASTCYDDCATKWPPYLAAADATAKDDWSIIDRTDGTKQWAYDDKPVYYFAGDAAKGDTNGDGAGGVWHVIKE